LSSDYAIVSTKHHLNDALIIRRELVNNSSASCALERILKTSIDTTSSPSLWAVGKEFPHSRKNVESRMKQKIKRKLLSRSKKTSTDGWKLNEKELDELHNI